MGRNNQGGFGPQTTAMSGFSLIELLIVIAIILVIAAIAIPNMLRARISANEASAASSVRSIAKAEMVYSFAYPSVGYASSLAQLGGPLTNCQPSAATGCLIDDVLTTGQKSGYQFQVTAVLPSGGVFSSFVAGAVPQAFNSTGVRDFCATTDLVLRGQNGATGDTPPASIATCTAFTAIQ
jgi:type IV pilus assembly protein PilA